MYVHLNIGVRKANKPNYEGTLQAQIQRKAEQFICTSCSSLKYIDQIIIS